MNHSWMMTRCKGSRFFSPALITGYKLGFRYPSTTWPGGGACDIVKDERGVVWGGLFEITESHLALLDEYEDVADGGYRRLQVVAKAGNKSFTAITYEVSKKLSADLAPVPGYAKLVISGARDCGLPASYLRDLESLF